jgi:hypothetical protein
MPHSQCTEIFRLAQNWVDDCFTNHPECKWSIKNTDPPLPKRLIEVSPLRRRNKWPIFGVFANKNRTIFAPTKTSDQGFVRIVQMEPESFGKWVALSHRWDVRQVFSLTKSNLQLLRSGISLLTASHFPGCYNDYEATGGQIPPDRFFMHSSGLSR